MKRGALRRKHPRRPPPCRWAGHWSLTSERLPCWNDVCAFCVRQGPGPAHHLSSSTLPHSSDKCVSSAEYARPWSQFSTFHVSQIVCHSATDERQGGRCWPFQFLLCRERNFSGDWLTFCFIPQRLHHTRIKRQPPAGQWRNLSNKAP